MPTITVDANKRLRNASFDLPYGQGGYVAGHSETVLTAPEGTEGRVPIPGTEVEFASVPGGMPVGRAILEVAEETVTTSAGEIAFNTIVEALSLFFQRWAEEDKNKPPMPPPGPPPEGVH